MTATSDPSPPVSPAPDAEVRLGARAKFGGGLLGIAWIALPPFFGVALLANVGWANDWLRTHGDVAILVYVAAFALFAGLGFFPTYAQALVGGWVFGAAWGFAGAIFGFVGGAAIGYAIARMVAGDGFRRWLDAKPKSRVIREAFVEKGLVKSTLTVALLRFPANSPFAITNLAMAASGVHWLPFLIGTAIGMAPRTFVATYIAASAAAQGERNFQNLLVRNPIAFAIGLVSLMVVAIVLGQLGKAALRRAGLEQ
jgi:uncharacterized membrane protein YdjX (TVP38/TMEM64 family)